MLWIFYSSLCVFIKSFPMIYQIIKSFICGKIWSISVSAMKMCNLVLQLFPIFSAKIQRCRCKISSVFYCNIFQGLFLYLFLLYCPSKCRVRNELMGYDLIFMLQFLFFSFFFVLTENSSETEQVSRFIWRWNYPATPNWNNLQLRPRQFRIHVSQTYFL